MSNSYARRFHPSPGKRSPRALLPLFLLFALATCGDQGTDVPYDPPGPPGGNAGEYDHLRAPGASAQDLLSGSDYERLILQVQYVEGFRPSDGGLQLLEEFLNDRVNKPGGVVIQVDEEPLVIEPQSSYSAADIRNLEEEHRTSYTDGTTMTAYLLFIDGEYEGGSNVLGIAYNNTSMALFVEKIRQYTDGPLEPSRETVEGTVGMHELGHILGLVNNGSDMQAEHQDEPNGKHCDNENCLMYYAVRTTDFISNLMGGTPDLDQNCLDDLLANGGR